MMIQQQMKIKTVYLKALIDTYDIEYNPKDEDPIEEPYRTEFIKLEKELAELSRLRLIELEKVQHDVTRTAS